MKAISFSDVLTFPQFKGMTEVMLLDTKMDKHVMPYLYLLGGDKNQGYQILANRHRNLNNKVVTGYRYVMQSRTDYSYTHSSLCETIDRIAAAAIKDPSLAIEMASLMNHSFDFASFQDGGVEIGYDTRFGHIRNEFPAELLESDWKETEAYLDFLQKTVLDVRGSPLRANGDLKGLVDYD